MKSVSLSAREAGHFLLLIRTLEVELRQVRPRLHLALPYLNDVVPLAHLFVDSVRVVELTCLIQIGELHGVTNRERSAIGLSLPAIILNSVVFPAPFGPMIPT